MKHFLAALLVLALGAFLIVNDADAKGRVGGGRSVGTQRSISSPQNTTTTPTPNNAAAPAAAPASGASRWLGPLAGLAAGLGLGWLIAHDGSGVLGTLMMVLLGGVVVMALLRFLRRDSSPAIQYASAGGRTAPAPQLSALDATASQGSRGPAITGIPLGFDTEGFLKEAKRNFLRIQEANDRADIAYLREVTTPEMFDVLNEEIRSRTEPQQTDVVALNATLLEIATEGGAHWASVRFSGSIREEASALPTAVEEIWNLRKPADDSAGWQLAGIQQLS